MLRFEQVSKAFGGVAALREVSLDVAYGLVTTIVGANGAGKTSLFNLVGLSTPDAGRVTFHNRDITSLETSRVARLGIARTFQHIRLCTDLPVIEHVQLGIHEPATENPIHSMFAYSAHSSSSLAVRARAQELVLRCGLAGQEAELVKNLSYGQQKLVALATALAASPKVILLDEPTAGLQPEMIRLVAAIIQQFVSDTTAVLLIEHDVDFVTSISDRIAVFDRGAVVAEGPPSATEVMNKLVHSYYSHA